MKYLPYIIIAILLLIAVLLYHNNRVLKQANKSYTSTISHINDTATKYRDQYDIEHAEKIMIQGDYQSLKDLYKDDIDDLTKRLKIKPKVIDQFIKVGTEVAQTLEPKIIYVDTTKSKEYPTYNFEYLDKYLTLNGSINKDSSKIFYTSTDSLGLTVYTRKSGFLKTKKDTYIDVFSYNPNVKIKSITSVKLDTKYKSSRIGIGPYVGLNYNISNNKISPSLGIGIHYSLIRL